MIDFCFFLDVYLIKMLELLVIMITLLIIRSESSYLPSLLIMIIAAGWPETYYTTVTACQSVENMRHYSV